MIQAICLPIILMSVLAGGIANSSMLSSDNDNNNIEKILVKTIEPEYRYEIDSSQIFPEGIHKQNNLTALQPEKFTLSNISYENNGLRLHASHLVLSVIPTKTNVDSNNNNNSSKITLHVDIYSTNVTLTVGQLSKHYSTVALTNSIYAVYDKSTHKVTVHIPIVTIARHLFLA